MLRRACWVFGTVIALGLPATGCGKPSDTTENAEVYEVEAGLLDLLAHKNSVTIEVGLRAGPVLANVSKDKAVALNSFGRP